MFGTATPQVYSDGNRLTVALPGEKEHIFSQWCWQRGRCKREGVGTTAARHPGQGQHFVRVERFLTEEDYSSRSTLWETEPGRGRRGMRLTASVNGSRLKRTRTPGLRFDTRLTCPPVTARPSRDALDQDEVGGACNHRRSAGSARCASPGRRMDSTAWPNGYFRQRPGSSSGFLFKNRDTMRELQSAGS